MKCFLCKSENIIPVTGKVRDLPELKILKCNDCELVFLESFDHIDKMFYEASKMRKDESTLDWTIHFRECSFDDNRRLKWLLPSIINKKILDFGCGGGGFLLRAKEYTQLCEGIEKDNQFNSLLNQKGIKVYDDIERCTEKYDVITLFHVIEHLKNPIEILKQLSQLLNENGKIIIETPNSDDALLTLYKNKAFSEFTYWSCHLFLLNNNSTKKLVDYTGLKLNYLKQIQRYPLSNHLYWLSNNLPGGHKNWQFIDSEVVNHEYESRLASLGIADTLIFSISK